MAEQNGIYKCNVCGNIVEVIEAHQGELVCCDKPMELLQPKTEDQGQEKHVPIIEIDGNKVKVKVGEIPHPMEEEHYIMLIEILKDNQVLACSRLHPGWPPEAEFELSETEGLYARIYCNLHGAWKSK